MLSIVHDRIKQLEKQKQLDDKLRKISSKCPSVVVDFLLLAREENRNNVFKVNNAGITQVYSNMVDSMRDEENKYLKAVFALDSSDPCSALDYLTRK